MLLDHCISQAMENNLDIKQEEIVLHISTYQERAAQAQFYPVLSVLGTDLYIKNNPLMSRYGGAILKQPFYSGGKLTNDLKSSQENKNAKLYNLQNSELLIENRVLREYLNCLRYVKFSKAYGDAIERATLQLAFVQDEVRKGRRGDEDILRWRALIDGYKDKLVTAEKNLANSKVRLNTLMNRDIAEPLDVADSHILRFEYADFMIRQKTFSFEDMLAGFYDYALAFSPDFKKKLTEIMVATYNYRSEQATTKPTIDILSNYNGRSLPVYGTFSGWDTGFYMNFDLYKQAKYENIKISELQLELSKMTEQRFLRDLKSDIRTLYNSNATSNAQVSLLRKQQKISRLYLKEISAKYASGGASNLDVVEAFDSFYTNQVGLLDAIINAFSQFGDLFNLIGFSFVYRKPAPNMYWRYREHGLQLDYDLKGLEDRTFTFMDDAEFERVKNVFMGRPSLFTAIDRTGQTALHYAADHGNVKCAEFLLMNGADPNALNYLDGTPLVRVICFCPPDQRLALTTLLIAHGADVNKVSHHYSPLCWAAMKNELEIVRTLVRAGAGVNTRDEYLGLTPLHYSAMWGNVEMAKFLIESGADMTIENTDQLTPYDLAWQFEHRELMNFFEKCGAR
jgi:outer membrane protein TolC